MENKVYKLIMSEIVRIENCKKINNEFSAKNIQDALNNIEHIEKQYLPHGSGVDCGCKVNLEKSNRNKLVIDFSFHHMNQNGFYDGWMDYSAIIKPDLLFDYELKIAGRNKNFVKEYLFDLFNFILNEVKII